MRRLLCVLFVCLLLCSCSVVAFADVSDYTIAGYPNGVDDPPFSGAGYFGGLISYTESFSGLCYTMTTTDQGYTTIVYTVELESEISAGDVICLVPVGARSPDVFVEISVDGSDWVYVQSGSEIVYPAGTEFMLSSMAYGRSPVAPTLYLYTVSAEARALEFVAPADGSRFLVRVRLSSLDGDVNLGVGELATHPFSLFFQQFYDAIRSVITLPIIKDVLLLGASALVIGVILKFMM